jgi:XapX domain-containing protein
MQTYIISLIAGVLAGVLYGVLGVRSPAPPVVALCGLLGMLLGEQAAVIAKRLVRREEVTKAWVIGECAPKVTGVAPEKSASNNT